MNGNSSAQRQNNFDVLRFVGACFVIITHAYALSGLPETDWAYRLSQGTFSFSRLGLWMFFIMSGYLVTASALRSTTVVQYALKRALRIIPAYSVVVLVAVFVLGPLVTELHPIEYIRSGQTWAYLKTLAVFRVQYNLPGVFLHNPYQGAVNGSLWTIPYEVFLYSIPAGLFFLRNQIRLIRPFLLIGWLVAVCTFALWTPVLWNTTVPFFLLRGWDLANFGVYFVAGSLLYLYRTHISFTKRGLLLASGLLVLSFFFHKGTIVSFFTVPYIVLALAYVTPYIPITKKIGDLSYGMYLYAFPIQQIIMLFAHGALPLGVFILLSILVTMLFAAFSWKFVEAPAIALKKHI